MILIADTREKIQWTFTSSTYITEIRSKKLDTGDYSVVGYEDKLTFERKRSVAEIATNLTEKRWPDVLARLAKFKHKFIICEFSIADILDYPLNSGIPRYKLKYIRIKPPFILSCLAKIQVDYQIPIIYAGNTQCAEIIVENIIKRIVCE
mgnify:CR=1 FL=1